jgi:hypothetical protein
MHRKRVLLLVDFSRAGYAAHGVLLGMHGRAALHVVLLVVSADGRSPPAQNTVSFAELMADAHRSRGATAEVAVGRGNPMVAVVNLVACRRFDLLVVGENLAHCRASTDTARWLVIGVNEERLSVAAFEKTGTRSREALRNPA